MFRSVIALAVTTIAALATVAPAAHAGVDVVVVGAFLGGSTAGGDPAPDNDGVFFGSGVPVINDAGEVVFPSSFTTGSQGTAVVRGSAQPGSLHLVVRQGDPAPDANGNFGVLDPTLAIATINGNGQVAFPTTFVGTFGPGDTSGIVRGDVGPDHLTLLARSGQTVDGVQLDNLGSLMSSHFLALNAAGQVVFSGIFEHQIGPNTSAIILSGDGSNTVVAKAGQSAPDASGTFSIVAVAPPAINDLGQVAFFADVSTTSSFFVELLRADGSTITQVVREGDPAPDHNGTFDLNISLGVSPALNASGEIGFVAALAGVTGPGTKGIFRATDPDHVVQIVRRADQTPDANGSFLDFDFSGFDPVAFNDAGQAAFLATLTATSGGSADNMGIFRGDGTTLVRVVRKGQSAPNADGSFAVLDPPAINAAGQVAFHATLAGTAKTEGIFLYGDVKGLTQVVRQGDPLLGSTIAHVRFAHDTSLGRKHIGINASGQVAFQFDLADGREGIAVWSATTTAATPTPTATITPTPTPSATAIPIQVPGATKCRAAIIKAGAGFVQAKVKALQKCEEAKVKGKLPSSTVCLTEAKTAPAITKAIDKLTKSIAAACGGKDKLCGGADDVSLAAIGWNITTCPNFENGTCVNTITSCSDIPTCLACIGEAVVDQAVTLYYGSLAPTDPKSKDKAVKALNKCQVTIGKSAVTFLAAKSKALAKCWGTVNKAGAGACPDASTSAAIAKAESKKVAAIKKACEGPDKVFGTADDFTPAQIGFPATCLDVTPPGGSSCGAAVSTLQDLVDCVDCVTEFKVDCADRAAVPGFAAYPPECGPVLISRRRYKKNIEYLGAADLQRLHDELLKFHLASYQYNMPGTSPATHLGFIIDDVTPSPSVAANGDTVDLYGYTSMAVAAVQTQEREIDTLKREVESLRAQIAMSARRSCGARAAATRRSKRARTFGGNDPG